MARDRDLPAASSLGRGNRHSHTARKLRPRWTQLKDTDSPPDFSRMPGQTCLSTVGQLSPADPDVPQKNLSPSGRKNHFPSVFLSRCLRPL